MFGIDVKQFALERVWDGYKDKVGKKLGEKFAAKTESKFWGVGENDEVLSSEAFVEAAIVMAEKNEDGVKTYAEKLEKLYWLISIIESFGPGKINKWTNVVGNSDQDILGCNEAKAECEGTPKKDQPKTTLLKKNLRGTALVLFLAEMHPNEELVLDFFYTNGITITISDHIREWIMVTGKTWQEFKDEFGIAEKLESLNGWFGDPNGGNLQAIITTDREKQNSTFVGKILNWLQKKLY